MTPFVTRSIIDKLVAPFKILKRETADKAVLIIEISFIFLLSFSFVYLLDLVLKTTNWYPSLESMIIGSSQWFYTYKRIFRVVILFTGILFGASLFFGLWMESGLIKWMPMGIG